MVEDMQYCFTCGEDIDSADGKKYDGEYFCSSACISDYHVMYVGDGFDHVDDTPSLNDHEMYYHMRNENPYGMDGGY